MDHLNDPNLDFDNPMGPPVEAVDLEPIPKKNPGYPDTDVESNRSGPSTLATSRNSTMVTFDEYVCQCSAVGLSKRLLKFVAIS
jgi:hypothetical protein